MTESQMATSASKNCFLAEENNEFQIDCRNALWATGDVHDLYKEFGMDSLLKDVDFIIKTNEGKILLVEYKNSSIEKAKNQKDLTQGDAAEELARKLSGKFYGTLPFLDVHPQCLSGRPFTYVCILEYPKADVNNRLKMRNRLKKKLPFRIQNKLGGTLISDVKVLSNPACTKADSQQ